LHGEKEDFEEYSINLKYAKLNFPILDNYSAEKHQPYLQATILKKKQLIMKKRTRKKLAKLYKESCLDCGDLNIFFDGVMKMNAKIATL
jgi:hypothetical protein